MKLPKDYRQIYSKNTTPGILPDLRGSIRLKAVFLALFLLIALVSTQLVFANSLATDGEKLSQIREEIKVIEKENVYLHAEIAKVSSLTSLSKEAQKSGYIIPQTRTQVIKF